MTDLNTIIIFESDIVIKEISEIMISNGLSAIQYLDLSECSPELIMSNKPDLIIIEIGEEDIDYKRKCLDSIVGKAPILLILNEINPVYNELFKINIQNLYFMTKPLDAVCFRNYIRLTKRIKEMEQKADAQLKTVAALEKSEANLRAIFDNTMQSIIFIGVDFKIKAFNIKASKMISLLTDEPL
ncbi:MAG: hypothetical protein QG635_1968, partial [Bacteroidota bacterium]|nr:hypothetical protein [Bacteroidota bacterium]